MITMEEAKKIFEEKGDYIILDVRTADEYAEGHIPRALNFANEAVTDQDVPCLPRKDQRIYVYCKSGMRSRRAALKLENIGYSQVIVCGGIDDWTGEIEK